MSLPICVLDYIVERDADEMIVKLMIVDDHVGIQGNGNQDTQSWFHSMEVNIMIDSELVCRDWMEQLHRNQSKCLATYVMLGGLINV